MDFQAQLQKDLAAMMDTKFFGRTVEYNGVPLFCSGATDEEKAHRLGTGLTGEFMRLIFRAPDLDGLNGPPVRGQEVWLDGIAWTVEAVDRQTGMVIVDFYRDAS